MEPEFSLAIVVEPLPGASFYRIRHDAIRLAMRTMTPVQFTFRGGAVAVAPDETCPRSCPLCQDIHPVLDAALGDRRVATLVEAMEKSQSRLLIGA